MNILNFFAAMFCFSLAALNFTMGNKGLVVVDIVLGIMDLLIGSM